MIEGVENLADGHTPLLIVGSSARAAAFSARRAGYWPICCDEFADADLQAVGTVYKTKPSFEDIGPALEQWPGISVLYTGAVENHLQLVEQLHASRPLLGNPPEVLRAVRDPHQLAEAIRGLKLTPLELRDSSDPPPTDGRWLLKPLRSAAGRGIVRWTEDARDSETLNEPHYFQEYAEGRSCSAVFVAQGSIGDVKFVGLTEQLIGDEAFQASGFQWCGNIGPIALSVQVESVIRRLGNYFKWKFQLRGLFGIDFIHTPDEQVYVTEVNPRYTSSVELLEFTTAQSLITDHCASFEDAPPPTAPEQWTPLPGQMLGKAVLYAPRPLVLQASSPPSAKIYRVWPRLADIPADGTSIPAGAPVCTIFQHADSLVKCREALRDQAARLLGSLPSG